MEIRPARPEDKTAVCDLWGQLIENYHKKMDLSILQQSFSYAVEHPDQVRIYVAVVEGKVAGTASLHQGHYSTWNGYWYGHVEDVIVNSSYRRRGLAEALLKYIADFAGESGLRKLELNALSDNTAARAMYEKIGFKTDSVVYELHI